MKPDPWFHLRENTAARIALGRAGGSLPTAEVLDFAMAHAAARDAVWAQLDEPEIVKELTPLGLQIISVRSAAPDRQTYLRRPDLGRRLDDSSAAELSARAPRQGCDVCLIMADGLSSLAAEKQGPTVAAQLAPMLLAGGISVGPLVVATLARVAIEDSIGAALGAKVAIILIGERPGLATADSLGAYLVFAPEVGRNDSERNCVSNIRPAGLPPAAAAETLHYLISQSLMKRISGVALKDDRILPTSPVSKQIDSGISL